MKVVAFMGSPRVGGNTDQLLQLVLEPLATAGIETEAIPICASHPKGCIGCMGCFKNRNRQCVLKDDPVNEWIAKMAEADGIILASPTYYANVSSEIKALIDRAGLVARANDDLFARKVGAAVVAVRRGGAVPAFDAINHMFMISKMILPCSIYWNFGIGLKKGDAMEDEEGTETMRELGANMAWLLGKIHA